MEGQACVDYSRTWSEGYKVCKNCGLGESSHCEESVASFYSSSSNPVAHKITLMQEAERWRVEATTHLNVEVHQVDQKPLWQVGMLVDGRDGNSLFECEILSVNIEDESCDVKWMCDGNVTKRLPYCALYLHDS